MGMETEQQFLDPLVYVILIVKLNNPLMGTETSSVNTIFTLFNLSVKLNNPLMGTETWVS